MKKNLGNLTIIALVIVNLIIWILFPPIAEPTHNYPRAYAGEVLGSTMIMLMSFSLFISTRPKWAEQFFGGLDKMYMTHRQHGLGAGDRT